MRTLDLADRRELRVSESQLFTLAMPSPKTLRAPAVWITARSWALAGVQRFGAARTVTPDGEMAPDAMGSLVDSLLTGASTVVPKRGRVAIEARTFIKDLRLAARHISGSRRPTERLTQPALRIAPFVWQHHDPFFTLGYRFAEARGLPLVLFVDAPHAWEARRWGVRRPGWSWLFERLGEAPQLREAELIVCVSDDVANAVQDLAGSGARVLVAPCTADPRFFADDGDRRAVRAELGCGEEDVVVGWAGSFRRFHALEDLIRAFDRIADQDPALRLVLLGDGPDRNRLVELAASTHAADRIVVPGQVPYTRMPDHVATFDVAVVTGRDAATFHYSPLKLREYRAAGKAIVAPFAGQVATTVRDRVDGLLYAPGDIADLARAIGTLVDDPDLRATLGSRARTAEMATGGASSQIDGVLRELGS